MKKNILILAALIVSIGLLNADIYVVDVAGGGDFTRIHDAVAAASDGDTVLVNSGTHYFTTQDGIVTVDKELLIQGLGYDLPEDGGTTLQSQGALFSFTIDAEGSILRGFRLQGTANPLVNIRANQMIIEENLFMNRGANNYALNFSEVADDTVRNNIFCPGIDGSASNGVYIYASSDILINNNLFAGTVLGIRLQQNANDKIMNNIFLENTSYGLQIGVNANYPDHAYVGGNIFMNGSHTTIFIAGSPTVTNNAFFNNSDDGPTRYEPITQDPLFVNYGSGENYDEESYDNDGFDFHLQGTSPCINAGPLLVNYNDYDGSRNDMGIYGWLWPIGTTGAPTIPVVNSISVTPTTVSPSGTITIEATGRIGE